MKKDIKIQKLGGATRDRTADPLLAKQVLSQLSYSPRDTTSWWAWVDSNYRPHPYQGCALTRLSYKPKTLGFIVLNNERETRTVNRIKLLSWIFFKFLRTQKITLRKEVIQPQVPLRLPCYDFAPVADPTVDGCFLAVSAPA